MREKEMEACGPESCSCGRPTPFGRVVGRERSTRPPAGVRRKLLLWVSTRGRRRRQPTSERPMAMPVALMNPAFGLDDPTRECPKPRHGLPREPRRVLTRSRDRPRQRGRTREARVTLREA